MRHLISLLLFLCIVLDACAAKYSYNYIGKPISDALADICRKNPEIKVSFIYNELENYIVKEKVDSDSPLNAIRQLVMLNPVAVGVDGDEIYVEAMQKGKYRYTGRIISKEKDPVGFATVVLLHPKDSTVITYGISDETGRFSIPCDRKDILVKVSSIGYKTRYVPSPSFSLGDITLDILAIELKNVTATADSRYALSDRTVFIPSGREKKVAKGGTELLQFMSIPSVDVSIVDKSIRTLSGQSISIFIDYLPATSQDLDNMRPEDVKRVEVLDYPSDPRFLGVLHAINFIMEKYEYGGYTKISDQQRLDFGYGYYSLSSKFSYGKMIYDVYTGYDHFDSDREYVNSATDYDFGNHSVSLVRNTVESHAKNNEAYLAARAQYVTDKTTISNQVSIRHNDTPENTSALENIFKPSIYPDGRSNSSSSRNSLTPSWSGTYHFSLPRSIRIIVTPSATYAKNRSLYEFTEDGTDIVNNVREKAWSANLGVTFSKSWKRNSISISANGELSGNRLHYTGDNPDDISYMWKSIGARASANLYFGRLRLQPSVKFYFSHTRFDDKNYTQPLPGYYIAGSVDLNRHHQLSFSSEMSQWTVSVSQRSPNIVVRDLLEAVQGNPSLKTWLYNSADINYTWLPFQWFYVGAFVSYSRQTKPMDYKFIPTEIDGREMMLRTYVKDGYFQELKTGLSATLRLFDNSLSLTGNMSVGALRRGGFRKYDRTVVNAGLAAVYYIGDFYLYGSYEFAEKRSSVFINREDLPSYYQIAAGWSKKGWNLSVDIKNPFRSNYRKNTVCTIYDNYSSFSTYFGTAYRRQFWINATYTISYGKKLKIEGIGRGNSVSSGIVD